MQAPRGWNRPVKPTALIVVSVLVLLSWLALSIAATLYFYEAWEARFTMREQPVTLRLPAGMQALAEVGGPVRTRVDMRTPLKLHLDQPMTVNLHDSLVARAQLQTTLPVDTDIEIDTVVPVQTVLDTSVSVKSWLPRVAVKLPLTLSLPVRMRVPVRAEVPVNLDLLASGRLPERLQVPVRGDFIVRPHVRGDLDVTVTAQTRFRLTQPLFLSELHIVQADVRLPMSLGLKQRGRGSPP